MGGGGSECCLVVESEWPSEMARQDRAQLVVAPCHTWVPASSADGNEALTRPRDVGREGTLPGNWPGSQLEQYLSVEDIRFQTKTFRIKYKKRKQWHLLLDLPTGLPITASGL